MKKQDKKKKPVPAMKDVLGLDDLELYYEKATNRMMYRVPKGDKEQEKESSRKDK
jgi:hypothetical protein